MLLRPWIRHFTMIISAWWLQTSSKFDCKEVKETSGKLWNGQLLSGYRFVQNIAPPSLSRDRRIKMEQNKTITWLKFFYILASPVFKVQERHWLNFCCQDGCAVYTFGVLSYSVNYFSEWLEVFIPHTLKVCKVPSQSFGALRTNQFTSKI